MDVVYEGRGSRITGKGRDIYTCGECLENPLDISTNLPENLIFSTFARLTGGGCGLPRYCSTFDIDTRRAELLVGRQIITM